jgi:glycerol uptake facilitator-like aquaporin
LKRTKGHELGLGFVSIGFGMAFFVAIEMFGGISASCNPAMFLAKVGCSVSPRLSPVHLFWQWLAPTALFSNDRLASNPCLSDLTQLMLFPSKGLAGKKTWTQVLVGMAADFLGAFVGAIFGMYCCLF